MISLWVYQTFTSKWLMFPGQTNMAFINFSKQQDNCKMKVNSANKRNKNKIANNVKFFKRDKFI